MLLRLELHGQPRQHRPEGRATLKLILNDLRVKNTVHHAPRSQIRTALHKILDPVQISHEHLFKDFVRRFTAPAKPKTHSS